ncbi:MAG: YitT family protein [Spirochaetaceae bacterium]|nr:YitT family protein [Spirochaetaceae bacterium]
MSNKTMIIRDYFFITLGAALTGIGWSAFLIPAKIVGGGVGGISTLGYYMWGITPGYIYLGINVILIILAVKILGASFGIRTVYGIICVSAVLTILPDFITKPIVEEAFLATIIGGGLSGIGIGLAITHRGSTGGTEIIAMIINRYRNISPGRIMLFLDVFIIASSYIIFQSLETMVYGYVMMAVSTYTVDNYLEGSRQSVQFMIISKHKDSIAQRINDEVSRGITILRGIGWYSKEETDPLLVLARRTQFKEIMSIIKMTDENAFISVSKVMGVYGNGFDRIRI